MYFQYCHCFLRDGAQTWKTAWLLSHFIFLTFSLIKWLCCFLLTWKLQAGKTPYIFVFHFFLLCLGSSASQSGWTRDVDELDFVSGGHKELDFVFPFIGGNFSCNFLVVSFPLFQIIFVWTQSDPIYLSLQEAIGMVFEQEYLRNKN